MLITLDQRVQIATAGREGHNRLNCPYKGHPCLSSKFCGDLNKHKDEKDAVSAAANRLQSAKKCLQKLGPVYKQVG